MDTNYNRNLILKKKGQPLYKKELCQLCYCCPRTLQRWMHENANNYERLLKLGYHKDQQLLSPEMVNILYPEWLPFDFEKPDKPDKPDSYLT